MGKLNGKYYDEWQSRADITKESYSDDDIPPEEDIIYAGYTYEGYEGAAIVVFKKDGKLYENHDYHCSCYGLERWEPEEGVIEAIKNYERWPGLKEALEAYEAEAV